MGKVQYNILTRVRPSVSAEEPPSPSIRSSLGWLRCLSLSLMQLCVLCLLTSAAHRAEPMVRKGLVTSLDLTSIPHPPAPSLSAEEAQRVYWSTQINSEPFCLCLYSILRAYFPLISDTPGRREPSAHAEPHMLSLHTIYAAAARCLVE